LVVTIAFQEAYLLALRQEQVAFDIPFVDTDGATYGHIVIVGEYVLIILSSDKN